MPRGIPIQPDELQHMLDLFNDCRRRGMSIMDSYERVGQLLDRDKKVVGVTINRLRPTTDMAKMYVRAKAYRLVRRMVKKANTSEIIDILSRPGIDVLGTSKKGDEGGGNFFISVQTESLGAVKVGIAHAQQPAQLESGEDFNPFQQQAIDLQEGVTYARELQHEADVTGPENQAHSRVSSAVAQARARLAEARGRRDTEGHQEDSGI